MNALEKLANLVIKIPIGIKYKLLSGEYKKVKIDPADNYQDVTSDLVSYENANQLIEKAVEKIDTSDNISDATVVAKIESLTTELTAQTAA